MARSRGRAAAAICVIRWARSLVSALPPPCSLSGAVAGVLAEVGKRQAGDLRGLGVAPMAKDDKAVQKVKDLLDELVEQGILGDRLALAMGSMVPEAQRGEWARAASGHGLESAGWAAFMAATAVPGTLVLIACWGDQGDPRGYGAILACEVLRNDGREEDDRVQGPGLLALGLRQPCRLLQVRVPLLRQAGHGVQGQASPPHAEGGRAH